MQYMDDIPTAKQLLQTILAALVIRCPGSSLSVSALKGLDEVSELFTRAQNACRARRALVSTPNL
jgi:hypothetical protein